MIGWPLALPEETRAFYRAAAARRHRVPGRCAVCGQPFVALPARRYCDRACRQLAYRQRRGTPAAVHPPTLAPPPLALGDWVALLRALDDTAAGRRGPIVALPAPDAAEVEFGTPPNHPHVRRVLRAWLTPAPPEA